MRKFFGLFFKGLGVIVATTTLPGYELESISNVSDATISRPLASEPSSTAHIARSQTDEVAFETSSDASKDGARDAVGLTAGSGIHVVNYPPKKSNPSVHRNWGPR